ncbi:hypothetical protein WDU94_008442 [Cyamophila willieti]
MDRLSQPPFTGKMRRKRRSVLSMGVGREMHAIKKGLLWQQRERLFSRWKERYFILTRDYLHCFKRSSGPDKISDMGQFIFKVKLVEVERVEWVNRKTYSVIALVLSNRESKILLRAAQGLEDWFELLEECTMTSKERRKALRLYGNAFYKDHTPSSTMEDSDHLTSISSHVDDWLLSRHPASLDPSLSDSVPDLTKYRPATRPTHKEHALWSTKHNPSPLHNRLSLLTDIDINYCNDSNGSLTKKSLGASPYHHSPSVPPSPAPCVNANVFFMPASGDVRYQSSGPPSSFSTNRPVLTPVGSFRNSPLFSPSRLHQDRFATSQSQVKYRDRSQSDALNAWKSRTAELNKNRRSVVLQATHV